MTSSKPRSFVALAVLLLGALLVWSFVESSPTDTPTGGGRGRAVTPLAREIKETGLDRVEARTVEPDSATEIDTPMRDAANAEEPIDARIDGVLLATDSDAPLIGWSVTARLVGQRQQPKGTVPHETTTGEGGSFALTGLSTPGPWELFVNGASVGFVDPSFYQFKRAPARVGTVMATPAVADGIASVAEPATYRAVVGPIVTITAPLPDGYTPNDLLFVCRVDVSPLSSSLSGLAGAALGSPAAVGTARSYLPTVSNSMRESGGTVTIRTTDGLYQIEQTVAEGLDNGVEFTCHEAFRETACFRFRTDPSEAIDSHNTLAKIVYSLRAPDGSRAKPGLLKRIEPGVLEMVGIPAGLWVLGTDPPEDPNEVFVPKQTIEATRGTPVPVVVTVRGLN